MNATTIVTIPAIAAIVYSLIDIVKTACGGDEKFKRFIPLVSAALGLGVAIPATVMYGSLRVRLNRTVVELEAAASQIVGYLLSKKEKELPR